MRDRFYINVNHRPFLKTLDDNNILGFHLITKKEIFLLAVSLGLNTPKNIIGKKDGYFLLKDVKSSDRALFGSILLGKVNDDSEVDSVANDEVNYNEAERCAESGFEILKSKIENAPTEELLYRRLMSEDI